MNRRILVVEDNAINSELLCDWLALQNFEATAVVDLAQAYAAIQAHGCDAVLLDIRLGEEDGADLAVWMREHLAYRNIPVIAVTAHALPAEQKRIVQAGCSGYISKPINFAVLAELLQRWLAHATPGGKSMPIASAATMRAADVPE